MRTVVCGVGNRMRGDDAVGPLVVDELVKSLKMRDVLLLDCGSAPENFTGKIEAFNPDKIVIIDAVDMGKRPGAVRIVEQDKIGGLRLSTHQMPLKMFIEYLMRRVNAEIVFVGVQPRDVGFDRKMSIECKKAVKTAVEAVKKLLE